MRRNATGIIGLFIFFGVLFMVVNLFTDTSGRWIFSWSWGVFFKVVVLLITGLFAIVQIVFTTIYLFKPKSSTSDDPPDTLLHWIVQLCLFIVVPIAIFIVLPIAIFILFLKWLLV